jgi:hypothetical protein
VCSEGYVESYSAKKLVDGDSMAVAIVGDVTGDAEDTNFICVPKPMQIKSANDDDMLAMIAVVAVCVVLIALATAFACLKMNQRSYILNQNFESYQSGSSPHHLQPTSSVSQDFAMDMGTADESRI